MRVLLTTSQSFLLLDTDTGAVRPIDRGHGLYYGIAHDGERMYVAARNRLVSSDVPHEDERGEIRIFDRRLKPCGTLRAPFPLRDLHEIAWHRGKLWATASFDNMIAIFDGETWEKWFPLGEPTTLPADVNHFNSFLFDDEHVWIMAHNRGASDLLAFSLETRELKQRIPLGNCAHNIWREDGRLFTCSSGEGVVRSQDGLTIETGGFPRGAAFNRDCRCIGISEVAERKARDLTIGKVKVFGADWTLRKEISLPDEGLILDMMRLPEGFRLAAEEDNRPASGWSRAAAFFRQLVPQSRHRDT